MHIFSQLKMLAISASIKAVLMLSVFTVVSTAVDIPGDLEGEEQQTLLAAVADENVDVISESLSVDVGSGESELFHGFLHEEIEKTRIITFYKNGTEKISSDEDVIKTLEYVNSTKYMNFLYNKPHFIASEMKRNVIGPDNRYTRNRNIAPYSAIGYLSPDGCTAYAVGPRQIITAAHCLHSGSQTGRIYSPSRISFYLSTCTTLGSRYSVEEVLVYSKYRNNGDRDYDIAYLLLSSSVPNWMGYAYRDPMPRVSGEICGYPSDQSSCFRCSSCNNVERHKTGWWIFSSRNLKRLQYTCDTHGGMSGSPVMTNDHDATSHLYSYGVHTGGGSDYNYGVRISRSYFYDICRWKCDTGATCGAVC